MNRVLMTGLAGSCLLLTSLFMMSSSESYAVQQAGRPAAPAQKSGAKPEKLEPGDVSVSKSRVYTFVGKTGLGHEHAIEGRLKSGHLKLNTSESAGEFIFDMTSFDADTDKARRYLGLSGSTDTSTRQQVNANMRGDAVLAVRRHPEAKFEIESSKDLGKKTREGDPQYELAGKFTLHGVTRPLKINVVVSATEDGMNRVRGSFSIQQTQYGITPFSKAFGAIGVTDKLTIHGDLLVASENRSDETASEAESR